MVHSLFAAVAPDQTAAALEGLGAQFRGPE
jgi:hypothetical protein